MQITRAADYMVRCVVHLAKAAPGAVVSRRAIVEATRIPDPFFRKIVASLSRAGIIEIRRGARGGYSLSVPPSELTLLRVVECGVGTICLNPCVSRTPSCELSGECPVHPVWHRASAQLRETLRRVTFAELVSEAAGTRDPGE